jgi:polysaccharide export outer membrane protein
MVNRVFAATAMIAVGLSAAVPSAQKPQGASAQVSLTTAVGSPTANDAATPGYVIGPDDVLSIVFWREKELSGDYVVRPDGKITLPLLNDVQAAGLSTEQLRETLLTEAQRFVTEPNATVIVKQINSRKVFITGMVVRPGAYSITAPTSVVQLLSMAGGVQEFADASKIVILRTENGRQLAFPFNYKDVLKRKNLRQNIELKPGDTVVVP